MQGLDTGEKVIYIGAFSKSLAPSVRVSYAVLPERLLKVYREKLNFYICPVPAIEQKTLCRFMEDGHFERHLNRMRNIYRKKRETLVTAVRQLLPGVRILGANAGLHLLVEIENGMSEKELIGAARALGVRVYGLSRYLFDGKGPDVPAILLGYAAMKQCDIERAVGLLKSAWFPAAS